MKLVCLADTHKSHGNVLVPNGDVLIFAGDMCGRGGGKSARKFITWFADKPHKHKVIVAGNHDRCFDSQERSLLKLFAIERNVTYLEHEATSINGVIFFGSPYQPEFCDWAFNMPRGPKLAKLWSQIPNDTEVLITHSPPYGILDEVMRGGNVGCQDLSERIKSLSKLKAHIFGHIHYAYGMKIQNNVIYVNASICNEDYEPINKPILLDI